MRLFAAAVLPEPIREALCETSALLRAGVRGRYVAPDSLHVTLAFLGEVEGRRVDGACAALDRACAGFAPFSVALGELGCFGRRAKAVLWQGFSDDGLLPELAQSVRGELRAGGLSFDGKAFAPHVTLMRAADLSAGALPAPVPAQGEISEIALFRSDLSGPRPIYEALHVAALENAQQG